VDHFTIEYEGTVFLETSGHSVTYRKIRILMKNLVIIGHQIPILGPKYKTEAFDVCLEVCLLENIRNSRPLQ